MANYQYDALVIGGGSAGLTTAGIAANFGAKTLMVERDRLGGDCTWTGCVPSKTLLKAATVMHQAKQAESYGLTTGKIELDPASVMAHVDKVRQDIYEDADEPGIFEEMGIEVVHGTASFIDEHTLHIREKEEREREVTAKYIFICTGARAFVPPVDGIDDIDYLTNESLFEIKDMPKRLAIIGGGPIGTEMSQAFARLGSEVTVIDMASRILTKDDPELSAILKSCLEEEGVKFQLESSLEKVEKSDDGIAISVTHNGKKKVIQADKILFATGRRAKVRPLKPELAGIEVYDKGIKVNQKCQTNKNHIYAVGDVTGLYQFTHMSEHMAKVATSNALIKIPMKIDADHVPWVTYTDPELGQIGATEDQLKKSGSSFEVYRFPYSKIDRAVTDGNTTGLIKVFATKWTGKILGASIVGAHAGEMISQYALAMRNGVSLRDFADTIHPYPSYGLGARRAADQWYIRNQSETMVKWIQRLFGYRGEIPDYSDPDRVV